MQGKRIIGAMLAVMTFFVSSVSAELSLSVAALGEANEEAALYTLDAAVTDAVPINETTFPDSTFRSYVSANFDKDNSGGLSREELNEVTDISVRSSNIASLKGVEYFADLKTLYCYDNKLTSLDVSKNTALEKLYCYNNKLTSLDVSLNTDLKDLNCCYNQLEKLDVKSNTALTDLSCGYNQLEKLDVKNNTVLSGLLCGNNYLAELDVRSNTALTNLDCESNYLTELDVKSNTALAYLYCDDNLLISLDLSNNLSLKTVSFDNNIYYIGDVKGSYCLGKLPAGFDAKRASNWQGAEYDSKTNSLKNFTSDTVTYNYDCGNGKSAAFTLIADSIEAGIIKESPADTAVIEGLDTSLTVKAEGEGLTYQWQRSSGDSWVNISGAVNSVLTLEKVTYDMNGTKYRCIVTAADEAVTSGEAVITVKAAEQVTVSEAEAMSIDEAVKFVNAYCERYDKLGKDTYVLTEAQLKAVEMVLEYDHKGQ